MEQEALILLRELCAIANKRNEINIRRHRARYRKHYYLKAIEVVEAYNEDNSDLRSLRRDIKWMSTLISPNPAYHEVKLKQKRVKDILSCMKRIRQLNAKPKKWQAMGLLQLRSIVLKAESEYALAKYETMELSLANKTRVKYLVKVTDSYLRYENGSVTIFLNNTKEFLNKETIKKYAIEHELNIAVHGMIQGQNVIAEDKDVLSGQA